jgi:hypothetical protein
MVSEPTEKDAEQYKNLKPGTALSLKCVTMGMTAHNEPQVAVEKINLSSVKVRPLAECQAKGLPSS